MIGPATTTFLTWALCGLVLAVLAAPHEHGSGIIYFLGYFAAALAGGLVHAVVVRRRSRRTEESPNRP
jgi:hypothetical protein